MRIITDISQPSIHLWRFTAKYYIFVLKNYWTEDLNIFAGEADERMKVAVVISKTKEIGTLKICIIN